jgi:osmoprotectant transport system permease protein
VRVTPSAAVPRAASCLLEDVWVCPEYLSSRRSELVDAVVAHLQITVVSVAVGALVALPLALLARRVRGLRPIVLGASTALYTVPSLALFSLLLPFTGLSRTTVVIGLVLYSLTVLVRTVLTGLEGVPEEVRDAARGMGFAPSALLWRVELPLALPVVVSGLRVATVSTVALTTVGTIVGNGGLGDLVYDGLRTDFRAEVLTASVLCVALALALDAVLLVAGRLLVPWRRGVA